MYLEQRIDKLETLVATLQAELAALKSCKQPTEQPQVEPDVEPDVEPETETPETETPIYTLDDVRAKVTEVMKADKSKKGALQALLKTHGADRVSELEESKFAIVIDAIEKGGF